MDAATRDELEMLRARAYGPSADIAQDVRAARRLRELEGLVDAPREEIDASPPADAGSRSESMGPPAPGSVVVAEEAGGPELDVVSADDAPTPTRGRSRWTRVWWVLSVVVAGSVAAAATYALTSFTPVQASHGAPQIATLDQSAVLELPTGWFGAGPSSVAFEFYGLTIFESSGGYGYGMAGTECISAIPSEQLPAPDTDPNGWSVQGTIYSGCRVGAFPATVELVVNSSVPEELRTAFPDGSGLQFVFDGERIGVFLDAAE